MQLAALIADSFRHALDRKLFWVLLAMTLLVTLVMVSFGFDGDRVTMLFGLTEADAGEYSPVSVVGRTRLVGVVVHMVMDTLLGTIGITLILIATAGLIPAMMESGTIDVLLSKPIGRPLLFFYKYLASMVFVLVQAALFVGLTFLVMGLRWGVWVPGYLLSIPLMVLLFSYVYCVSALVAVITRSTLAAILLSLAAWVAFAMLSQASGIFEAFPKLRERRILYQTVQVVSWIPPKTSEVTYLAAKWAGAGTGLDTMPSAALATASPQDREQFERTRHWEHEQLEISALRSIGSSLLFEAALVLLAMWRFTRADF